MKQRAFRQNPTVGTPSKKARLRRRGQTAMSMYYTMQANFIALLNSPGWSMTCRANFVGAPGGARFLRVQVPNPPGSGKDIAEGKGVHCEVESEGSQMWGTY